MHRRGPVPGHCRPGPPRVTPASAHFPPRGSPHVNQLDTRDVDPGAEVARRRRPLVGIRFAPVTLGAAPQRGPPGCSPVPGEASLVREATVGRRRPERSKGGLSARTIQVPAGRGEAPPRHGGCALRGLGNPGWPRRVDDWAPVTNRLGTPQFGGQCVGGYRGARRGDRGWCHDGEPRPRRRAPAHSADRVHGNAKVAAVCSPGARRGRGSGSGPGTAMRWAISGSGCGRSPTGCPFGGPGGPTRAGVRGAPRA